MEFLLSVWPFGAIILAGRLFYTGLQENRGYSWLRLGVGLAFLALPWYFFMSLASLGEFGIVAAFMLGLWSSLFALFVGFFLIILN